jgi:hypothetical protein
VESKIDKLVGLCANCANVEIIRSDRGSVFYLCKLSAHDPRFPKYPRLPVLSCAGYGQRSASYDIENTNA